jgi:AsmA protein
VTTDRLQVQGLAATRVSAKVSLDRGKLEISELSADFLGGKHRGQWRADFSVKPAVCAGSGSLTELSLASLADAMKDRGISGTANASYEAKGSCPAEFWASADGTLRFVMDDGALPHISLGEDMGGLRFTRFTGQARLQTGTIEMKDATLSSPAGTFRLSGTASLKGELDFNLARTSNGASAPGYAITGTLAEPRVIQSSSPDTQARLKAEPAKQP